MLIAKPLHLISRSFVLGWDVFYYMSSLVIVFILGLIKLCSHSLFELGTCEVGL